VPDSLRILHLEDDAADAELVGDTLRAEGLACEIVRVSSRASFETALDERRWALILSDFALPGFDGAAAQAIAAERQPDVPFVFVSGTIGEEVAIERLKAGATDYVLKQRLGRLTPAVRRALQESRERRERLRAEQANDFLEHLLAASPSIVFSLDPGDMSLTYVSTNIGWLLGYTRSEAVGVPHFWQSIIHPGDHDAFVDGLASAFASAAVQVELEYRCRAKDGQYRWFFNLLRVDYDTHARATSVLGYALDIAGRKAAEEEGRVARLEADRANRAKSDFLSRMSHDLRTPLNAILGFAQILQMDPLSREQADSVEQILKGGRHLLDLINEVLDITRIEAGHLSLSMEPVQVTELVQQTIDLLHPLAAARGIKTTLEVAPFCPSHVRGDRQRLKQVLVNLVGNAVKYNREAGRVVVSCSGVSDSRVRVSISDTGRGIPAGKLQLLFQPFERLGAESSPIEGTGLGLTVSKGLVQAMNGTLGVESAVGRGSTFWFELPQAEAVEDAAEDSAQQPAAGEGAPRTGGGTILYIEDNVSNVRLLQRLLGRRPAVRLIAAPSGLEGLARIERDRPDLVLLDLHLPDLPGEEVLQRILGGEGGTDTAVVVLSADATPSQRQRLLASGAIAYLTKPIDIGQLLQIIDARLRGADHPPARDGGQA
jgi:PAS domain S-box-containing protein